MSSCCSGCGKPPFGDPGVALTDGCLCPSPSFTKISDLELGGVVGQLTNCVDGVRDIYTQLGARTYEVRLVWSRWTGGERGVGEEYVFHEELIQPTPLIADLAALDRELTQVGLAELGKLRVTQISPRYTERTLLGQLNEVALTPDTSFYWEVSRPAHEGERAVRRRFFPASPPSYKATDFDWSIVLVRAHGDRLPDGLPHGLPPNARDD